MKKKVEWVEYLNGIMILWMILYHVFIYTGNKHSFVCEELYKVFFFFLGAKPLLPCSVAGRPRNLVGIVVVYHTFIYHLLTSLRHSIWSVLSCPASLWYNGAERR